MLGRSASFDGAQDGGLGFVVIEKFSYYHRSNMPS